MRLEVDSVFYQKGRKVILSDVHLSLETGEVLGLLGRNGSGKSSLFKLMFGLAKAEFFQLRVDGKPCINIYNQKLLQYLPQQNFLPNHFRISQTLKIYDIELSRQQFILDLLQEEKNQKLGPLSGGKRRLFEVIVLLYSKVPFLILDEPFTGLTPLMIEQIGQLIKESATSKGILITDHMYRSVMSVSDRLMFMKNGTLKVVLETTDLEDAGYLRSGNF